jgi:hypothetical protein
MDWKNMVMNIITDFARSGFWDHKEFISSVAFGLPVAIEGGVFLKNVYQKPKLIKEKLTDIKDSIVHGLTAPEKKKTIEKVLHVAKNIFLVLLAISIASSLAYLSIVFLPSSMGLSVAMLSIIYTAKFFLYAKWFVNQCKVQEDETLEQARKRIILLVIKNLALIALSISACAILGYVVKPLFTAFDWHPYIPFQTPLVVFLEYIAVGTVHLGLATKYIIQKKPNEAIFHIVAAALSLIFPLYYLNYEMRLHHSFYGLVLMTLPYRPAKFFGSLVTFDSLLYFISPERGYFTMARWGQTFHSYDFINVVVEKFPFFFGTFSSAIAGQEINDGLKSNPKYLLPV